MKYEIIFVCQEGLLEVQAFLLAASLRKHIIGDYTLTAAIPDFGQVSSIVYNLLTILDVNVRHIKNNFYPFYAEGNKIISSCLSPNTNKKIFLDSDNLCISDLNLAFFDDMDFYCLSCDPHIALNELEWLELYKYFNLKIPFFSGLNKIHTQSCLVMFSEQNDFSKKWERNAKILNRAIHKNYISIKRKRQIDQLSLGITLRSHNFDNPIIDNPMTWNFNDNWWHMPKCNCHPWEHAEFIGNRTFNKIICSPDMIFGYKNKKPFCLGIPKIINLQNGANFCHKHQGIPEIKPKFWIDHYPLVKNAIDNIIDKFPSIKSSKYWEFFEKRYLKNDDNIWFNINRNAGNFIPNKIDIENKTLYNVSKKFL